MKIRSGFVSNSSSCSFLVLLDEEPNTEVNMKDYCEEYGSAYVSELELSKDLKALSDNIDKIPSELKESLIAVMAEATIGNNGCGYVNEETGEYDPHDVWTPEMVAEEFQKEYEAGKGKEFHMEVDEDGYNGPMGSENWNIPEEQFMPFKDWKEDLKNPKGYFRQAVKQYITWGLESSQIENGMTTSYNNIRQPLDNHDYDDRIKGIFDNLVEVLTQTYIDDVLDRYGDCQAYFVHYVTDGESTNPFRYIAETTEPFKNFPLYIKYNNH